VRGRKPVPTKTLETRNTFKINPNRKRPNEPEPPTSKPKLPRYLGATAKTAWKKLYKVLDEMSLLSSADHLSMELYAQAYQDYRKACVNVEKFGQVIVTVKGGRTYAARNPFDIVQERKALLLVRLLTEFGLTPSSRARVHAMPKQKNDPFTEFLKAREARISAS